MSGGGGGGGAAATDHYEVLEVSETSDHGDIRKAYFRLAMKYHPDKNPDNREWATERFKAISEAYAVLSDEAQRKQYDEMRQGLGDGARPFTHTHTTEDNTTNFDAFSNMRPGAVDPFQMFNAFFSREFGVSLDDDMGFASSGKPPWKTTLALPCRPSFPTTISAEAGAILLTPCSNAWMRYSTTWAWA
uniref:J domain-containing protein n=1 Tax=Phaeomonas parva TaxID=124430 RepID=A0A6U4LCU1_9STRA|mmetsp:Transcript_6567/g.18595  ORF Transcript_6567/g.18595 Transcript_6567/m.18595 type:complete len:189 (+) Transcript_6567:298-864(+)